MTNSSPELALSTREQLHTVTQQGRILLDRWHYNGWTDFSAEDYLVLSDLRRILYFGLHPDPESDQDRAEGELKPYEQATLIRDAIGAASIEEAVTQSIDTLATLSQVMNGDFNEGRMEAFYAAQQMVRQVWQGTAPVDFAA